jgi:hypothetical protein
MMKNSMKKDYKELIEIFAEAIKQEADDSDRDRVEVAKNPAKKVSIRITSSKILEFIVAKNPTKVYKFNFLHLILNSDVDGIVMLEDIRLENNYLLEYEDRNLTVETVATIETVKCVRRDICITFANHSKIISRKINQFLYCNWESMPDIPNDRNDIIEFIKVVNKDSIDLVGQFFIFHLM